MGGLAGIILLAVGWHVGTQFLEQQAQGRFERELAEAGGVPIVLENAPPWLSPLLRKELAQRVAEHLRDDPLNADDLNRAAIALSHSSWIERVRRLRRHADGSVSVWADYRQPVAVVEGRDGYHLVDAGGVRLPGLYLTHQLSELDLPLITGVSRAPRGEGERWPGDDLQAGLAMVRVLADAPYRGQIRAIDVHGRDARDRVTISLLTRSGEVRWGLAPTVRQSTEPDTVTKKSRLLTVYEKRGAIDAGGRVVEIFGSAILVRRKDSNGDPNDAAVAGDPSARRGGYTWSP